LIFSSKGHQDLDYRDDFKNKFLLKLGNSLKHFLDRNADVIIIRMSG